jgi:voltage-gated potassium channel
MAEFSGAADQGRGWPGDWWDARHGAVRSVQEAKEEEAMRLRQILWHQLDPKAYQGNGLSPANKAVVWVVAISSLIAVVETEPSIEGLAPWAFAHVEQIFSVTFLIEYLARLWAEGEDPRYKGLRGRFRYAISPAAIIDLIAFLPSLVFPGISSPMLLRMFRLMRILRLARLGRFSTALGHLTEAVTQRRDELLLSLMLATMILVFSAAAMYVLEGEDDPVAFGSIPRALWWSVCTLTTVGYGDIYPHSVLGKICGGLTSIAGIGLIAMPTGILAAAFSEAFQRTRHRREGSEEWSAAG